MERESGFNLFRVNCLLNDSKSANFNSIILSIVYEYYYETANKPKTINEIFVYLKEYLKIVIDYDFLNTLISKSEEFIIDPDGDISTITVNPEKFQSIEQTIAANAISNHISRFLKETNSDVNFLNSIESLLYVAVFENINSFSVDNLKTIIPNIENEEFSKEEIEIFNSFLDFDDDAKNKAIFNILSRAVEFALLTSGKGIREFSQSIFGEKTFILDTNIIFRLIGVGGQERHESTLNLLEKCSKLGIKFEYTGKTHLELHNKLEQIINYLNTEKVLTNIDIIGEISEHNPEMFNDDFIIHYSLLKRKGDVSTPEQYQRKLSRDYQILCERLGIKINRITSIDEGEAHRYGKYLLLKKQEMAVRYGRKPAEVDAFNVLIVRHIRGGNDYNLSDVKSFYLTSDRSLNAIISNENKSNIPETILPSQLYILCKPYFDTDSNDDYEDFIEFIKRRKTGFKYGGSQVLTYINSIRELTTDVEVISESLVLYSNIRFNTAKDSIYATESTIPNYKTVLKTLLDNRIEQGREAEDVFGKMKTETEVYSAKKLNTSRNFTRIIDVLLTISIIPILILFSKIFTSNNIIPIIGVLIGESLKFYLSSRFRLFNQLHSYLYKKLTNSKRKEYARFHNDLVVIIDKKGDETANSLWG